MMAVLLGAQVAAVAPSMTVTPDQLREALKICSNQISASTFDRAKLPAAGWPKVMSQGPDAAGYEMTTYRHPTTMLMVALVSDPHKPSECSVIAPWGQQLDGRSAGNEANALFGKRRGALWKTDMATIEQFPMAGGLRFTFTKKAAQ